MPTKTAAKREILRRKGNYATVGGKKLTKAQARAQAVIDGTFNLAGDHLAEIAGVPTRKTKATKVTTKATITKTKRHEVPVGGYTDKQKAHFAARQSATATGLKPYTTPWWKLVGTIEATLLAA